MVTAPVIVVMLTAPAVVLVVDSFATVMQLAPVAMVMASIQWVPAWEVVAQMVTASVTSNQAIAIRGMGTHI